MFEIGNSLREARLRQHLEFPEIEQATKIRGKYLRALEDEQFDVLPAQTPGAVAKPPVATNGVRLIVTAMRGNCWLEVHSGSATGRIIFQGTLERGQRHVFTGRKLWITLDRPENLRTILNGRTRVLSGGGVKTLIVTARGIRPGV